jgi:hypothetical protein
VRLQSRLSTGFSSQTIIADIRREQDRHFSAIWKARV